MLTSRPVNRNAFHDVQAGFDNRLTVRQIALDSGNFRRFAVHPEYASGTYAKNGERKI